MKAFIEEYGLAILVIAVIVIMIAMTTPIGDMFKEAMLDLFGNLKSILGGSSSSGGEAATTAALNTMTMAA